MVTKDSKNENKNANKSLSLINKNVKSLLRVPLHGQLTSLNLHFNLLQRIECLYMCPLLSHLDLSSNRIANIEGLNSLQNLEVLNLSSNLIENISNLGNLKSLKSLDLSYNRLKQITGLEVFTSQRLTALYLEGNRIDNLHDALVVLKPVSSLKTLVFDDTGANPPLSPSSNPPNAKQSPNQTSLPPSIPPSTSLQNAICQERNYRRMVLDCLPNITSLDHMPTYTHLPIINSQSSLITDQPLPDYYHHPHHHHHHNHHRMSIDDYDPLRTEMSSESSELERLVIVMDGMVCGADDDGEDKGGVDDGGGGGGVSKKYGVTKGKKNCGDLRDIDEKREPKDGGREKWNNSRNGKHERPNLTPPCNKVKDLKKSEIKRQNSENKLGKGVGKADDGGRGVKGWERESKVAKLKGRQREEIKELKVTHVNNNNNDDNDSVSKDGDKRIAGDDDHHHHKREDDDDDEGDDYSWHEKDGDGNDFIRSYDYDKNDDKDDEDNTRRDDRSRNSGEKGGRRDGRNRGDAGEGRDGEEGGKREGGKFPQRTFHKDKIINKINKKNALSCNKGVGGGPGGGGGVKRGIGFGGKGEQASGDYSKKHGFIDNKFGYNNNNKPGYQNNKPSYNNKNKESSSKAKPSLRKNKDGCHSGGDGDDAEIIESVFGGLQREESGANTKLKKKEKSHTEEKMGQDISRLEESLSSINRKLSILKEEKEEREEKNDHLEKKMKKKEEELMKVEKKLVETKSELERMNGVVKTSREKCAELEKKLSEKHMETDTKLSELKGKVRSGTNEIARLKVLLKDANVKNKDLEKQLANEASRFENYVSNQPITNKQELTREIEERIRIEKVNPLNEKIVNLEKSYKDLENEFRDALISEEKRYFKLKSAFDISEGDLGKCKEERGELRASLEKNLKLLAELNEIVKERKEKMLESNRLKDQSIQQLNHELNQLRTEMDRKVSVETDHVMRKEEEGRLRGEVESLRIQNEGLKNEKRMVESEFTMQISKHKQEVASLQASIDPLKREVDDLHDKLSKFNSDNQVKDRMLNDQNETLMRLKGSNKELKEENEKLQKNTQNLFGQIETLNANLDHSAQQCDALRAQLVEMGEVVEGKEEENQKLKMALFNNEKEISLIEERVGRAAMLKETYEREVGERQALVEALKKQEVEEVRNECQRRLIAVCAEAEVSVKCAEKKVVEVEGEMRELLLEWERERRRNEERVERLSGFINDMKAGKVGQ